MNIVTTTSVFPPCYSPERALLRLSACGFRHLDLGLDYWTQQADFPFVTDAWERFVWDLSETASSHGVQYTQAHACGDVSCHTELMRRNFEVCRILNVPYLVVHPVYRERDGQIITDAERFVQINATVTKPLLELAERCNVTVLSENLLWGASIEPAAISALVEAVNSPYFGWCYDTGHANAFGIKPDVLLGLKRMPLSLHVQDNHGTGGDEHLLPGDGTIDWKLFLEVLHRIGYRGDLVLEAHHQSLDAPDEARDALLTELYRRARLMRDDFYRIQTKELEA